jgi:shikimate kinase
MNIYLLGMMGSGKSTVGRSLSQYMDKPFIDLDLEIEQSVGKTIAEIFENDGEKYFRNIESNQLYQYSDSVVACGGGIILNEGNRTFIKKNGKAILLTASIAELSERLSTSENRPLLPKNNMEETLTILWLDRQLRYLNTAEFTIETDGKTPEKITQEILNQLDP